jgi:NADH-quinone oxidoreductase subunit G
VATVTIDGKQYSTEAGQNLLQLCLSVGIDLPYFCWHPVMGSVGACRQCAAKQFADENDQRGRLVTACMTPVQDGDIFSVENQQAKQFRATVIESLMTNHPHDCPVCEEGGECHLQDMTEMTGHTSRRYRGKKRTHNNQNLGPFIKHEMNRCISCYRCVRFYNDYAGAKDLAVFASHNHVFFGREKDGVLESEFAGNLVEVCPTGVFTDKTFSAHYSRKWDLQTAPSICNHCAVGCNTTPGSRYQTVRRVVNRFHSEINAYFLCDRGRFAYGYNNSAERVTELTHNADVLSTSEGVARLAAAAVDAASGSSLLLAIGSPRASLENNFALRQFVGDENFYAGVSEADYSSHRILADRLASNSLNITTVKAAEQADLIVILGEDIAETAPRMALAIRQASRNKGKELAAAAGIVEWQDAAVRRYCPDQKTPIFIASLTSTRLDDVAEASIQLDPRKIAALGMYIADQINNKHSAFELEPGQQQWADQLLDNLAVCQRPLIISGSGYQQPTLLSASLNLYDAVKKQRAAASYYFALPEANSLGLALLANTDERQGLAAVLQRLQRAKQQGQRRVLLVLENDLYRRGGSTGIDALLAEVDELLVMDYLSHATTQRADYLFPVTTVLESQGTLVSAEGRAQRYYAITEAVAAIGHSWRWLVDAAEESGLDKLKPVAAWQYCDDISRATAEQLSGFRTITALLVDSDSKFTMQSHRYSGRTAMDAHKAVAERRVVQNQGSPFAYSMEGLPSHGPLENSVWSPGWNSNQAIHKFQQQAGGGLVGGESGLILFPYNSGSTATPLEIQIPCDSKSVNRWLLFPVQTVFGSEELSARADAIAELAHDPCVIVNAADAETLQLQEWESVLCTVAGQQQVLSLRVDNKLPAGLAGVLHLDQNLVNDEWPLAAELCKASSPLTEPATDREQPDAD